jgi:ribosomal protein L17
MVETIETLQNAAPLAEFCNKIRQKEKESTKYQVAVYDLKFYPGGILAVKSKELKERFSISEQVIQDLARLADIPAPYFKRCDRRLQSVLFNYHVHRKVVANKAVQLVLRDRVVDRVLNSNLLPAPRLAIMNTVANAKPETVTKEDLKIVNYAWNGEFDVSIISPNINCQPRKDDIVAFGVNISEGRDGAIQIQGAAFRCICSNGAINQICDSRQHRLRRPINSNERQEQLLSRMSVFAHEAWGQCAEHSEALRRLTEVLVDIQQATALKSRLRQAPFFLSLRVINQVISRLEIEFAQREGPTLYDLYNAMTFVGTHNLNLSLTYRTRLRLGAGEFTRNQTRVCSACRQLLLT